MTTTITNEQIQPQNNSITHKFLKLTTPMKVAREKQIEEALGNNAYLKLSDSLVDIVGTNNLAESTHSMYRTLLNMFDRFLLLIGEGDCRLILHPMQPSAAMPIKPENVALFIKFKSGKKGNLLENSAGQQINDIFGNPVRCEGTWTAPMNVTRFVSAINRLHQLRNHMGQYSDKCPDCLALPQERHHIGCKAHEPCPCCCREGNSIKDGSLLISCKGNMKQQRDQTTRKALIDPHHISPLAAFVGNQ